jgi:hypothetical protein
MAARYSSAACWRSTAPSGEARRQEFTTEGTENTEKSPHSILVFSVPSAVRFRNTSPKRKQWVGS